MPDGGIHDPRNEPVDEDYLDEYLRQMAEEEAQAGSDRGESDRQLADRLGNDPRAHVGTSIFSNDATSNLSFGNQGLGGYVNLGGNGGSSGGEIYGTGNAGLGNSGGEIYGTGNAGLGNYQTVNNNPTSNVPDTTNSPYGDAPVPVNRAAEWDSYNTDAGDPTRLNNFIDIEGRYQQGLTNNTYGVAGGALEGTGRNFNSELYLRENPDLQSLIDNGGYGDGASQEETLLRHYNEYGRGEGRGGVEFADDPNSVIGTANRAGDAYGDLTNRSNTNQRGSTIGDVENFGGRLNAANRAANPELEGALNNAEGLGGRSNFYGSTGEAINNAPRYGDIGFNGAQTPGGVNAGQVGAGALGNSLYSEAMGAGGLGQVGQTLQGRAQGFANSQGNLSADELRAGNQSIREGQAARGVEMGQSAVTAEALGRLTNKRGRMMQDIAMGDSLNQSNLAEIQGNRNFRQGVQGAGVARQQSNAGLALTGDMANQSVAAQYGLTNQAQQQDLNTQNRNFAQNQDQTNIANQAKYAALLQGQQGDDRNYAQSLVNMQQGASTDAWSAMTGVNSNAAAQGYDIGQQGFENASTKGLQNIDPDSGVNLALTNNQNLANYNMNRAATQATIQGAEDVASATRRAGNNQLIGNIAGSIDWGGLANWDGSFGGG